MLKQSAMRSRGAVATGPPDGTRIATVEGATDLSSPADLLIARVAHELRQPLASILAATAVIGRHINREMDEHARQVVERQTQYLTRLVDDLLDVARIKAGKLHLRKERLDLRQILGRAAESVHAVMRARGHELVMAGAADDLWVMADPDRLHQVFSNLLENAAKYSAPGGAIWISLSAGPHSITIAVRDTGRGLAPDLADEVFASSAPIADSTPGGLGIGLRVVRELVELHGGTVELRSAGPNYGSEFIVTLPATAIAP
jgi:signal transduction histidine kinase